VWAVKTLMKLVNNATKPEPAVRDLSGTSANLQARVVAGEHCSEGKQQWSEVVCNLGQHYPA